MTLLPYRIGSDATIIYRAAEVRGYIVVVHELPLSDVASSVTNGIAVFDDVLSLVDVAKGELMTSGDSGQLLQGYGHRVNGIYL
jgi:hypothetical protein